MNDVVERSTFVVSVLLQKNDGNRLSTTHTLSHRVDETRDEAVVRSLEYARKVRPDFAVIDWLVLDVLNPDPDASSLSPEELS